MKYLKPDLHLISVVNAVMHCVNGSIPGGGHVCETGVSVAVETCQAFGSAAHSGCRTGVGADATCNTGDGVGNNCVTGGTP